MKFPIILQAAFASLAAANFDLYVGQETGTVGGGANHAMWHIFNSDPSCDDVTRAKNYFTSDDVSGRKTGVRCKGGCAGGQAASDIEELEMHFSNNPLYHFTIYRDRNYDMYGLDGNIYGTCILFPGNDYSCFAGIVGRTGVRKFRCLTHLTAPQIEAGTS